MVARNAAPVSSNALWPESLITRRVFGKSPLSAFLRLNAIAWKSLPASVTASGPIASYGRFLHKLIRMQGNRGQLLHTFFLRNRAFLELIRRVVATHPPGELRVAVLGCSAGAEAYSIAWRVRSARPDLDLVMHAVDVSRKAVEVAGTRRLFGRGFGIHRGGSLRSHDRG